MIKKLNFSEVTKEIDAGNYSKALKDIKQILNTDNNNILVLSKLCYLYLLTGKLEAAEQKLEQLILTSPDDSNVKQCWARLYQSKNQLDKAYECIQNLIAIEPGNPENILILSGILMSSGHLSNAINQLKNVIELYPNYAEAYSAIGICYLQTNKEQLAIKALKSAISLKPHLLRARILLHKIYTNNNITTKAIENIEDALTFNPININLLQNYNSLLLSTKDIEKAVNISEKMTVLEPDNFITWFTYGVSLQSQQYIDLAEQAYIKALKLEPNHIETLYNLGLITKEKLMFNKALKYFTKIIDINPQYENAYLGLAEIYKNLYSFKEAFQWLERAYGNMHDQERIIKGLITLLSFDESYQDINNEIIKSHRLLKKIKLNKKINNRISDSFISELIKQLFDVLPLDDIKLMDFNQSYRGKLDDKLCSHYKLVFNTYNVIPESCFSCFKILISPNNVVDFIKLYVLFDQLELEDNNIRKCHVELRDEIPGAYKGLVYCNSIEQVYRLHEIITKEVHNKISNKIPITIKRGCSEFPIAYPEYEVVNIDASKLMKYDPSWKRYEDKIKQKYNGTLPQNENNIQFFKSFITLRDYHVIQYWLGYAAHIKDESYKKITDYPIKPIDGINRPLIKGIIG